MRNLLVISPHSFVDLITNSSTELFVCDTEKTLQAVKELLAKLLKMHDELTNEENTFESVFKEPYVAKYEFDFYNVPNDIRENYGKHCSYGNPFVKTNCVFCNSRSNENEERTILDDKELRLRRSYVGTLTDDEHKQFIKDRDELWTDYGIKSFEATVNLFVEFLKQNSFTSVEIGDFLTIAEATKKSHKEKKGGEHVWLNYDVPANPKLSDAWDTFTHWEGYGITAKKGSILVESTSDNTIPYSLMDTISSYLNAERYHLG
jgi:hypothetical protein